MRISEKAQQIEILDFLMNDQNIIFCYTPPMENRNIKKCQSVNFDECPK